MKYIKNGKLVLDGTIRECDLQDKLNKALEIIVKKNVNVGVLKTSTSLRKYHNSFVSMTGRPLKKERHLIQEEYKLLKEIIG